MAFKISLFDLPGTIFLGALIIVVIAIITLLSIERKMNKTLNEKKLAEQNFYQRKISEIDSIKGDVQQSLIKIDSVAREFFAEKFKIDKAMKYSEIMEFFKRKEKREIIDFCGRIQEALYGGQELNQEQLEYLIKNLKFIIEKERSIDLSKEVSAPDNNQNEEPSLLDISKKPSCDKKILVYLEEGRKRGFSFLALKQKLLEHNIDEKEIDRTIFYLGKRKSKEDIENQGLKREKIKIENKPRHSSKEPENYRYVRSLDDMERLKMRIKENRGKDALDTTHRKIGVV